MEAQKLHATAILAIALAIIIITVTVTGLLATTQRVQNSGNVRATIGLGVYSDQACTSPLSSINWGEVIPGQSYQKTIYLKNLGNVKVKLSMTTGNWTPSSANTYLTLTWNRENTMLDVGASISATFTLTVSSNAQGGQFSFDISIVATESQ
ncbi:MAG: hypothetical protein QXZ68_03170 [Candidatus Bathyarchaeia archaeon]